MYLLLFFFFQAEDGIRDSPVTGVQTCALPISKNLQSFKKQLDHFLMKIPDNPPTPGYSRANTNSLTDWGSSIQKAKIDMRSSLEFNVQQHLYEDVEALGGT